MTLTYSPAYPLAGDEVTVSLVTTTTTGTAFAYELTSVPAESAIVPGLLLVDMASSDIAPATAIEALERGLTTDTFTPDVPGSYGVSAYEFYGTLGQPSYAGDPSGADAYTYAATQTGTVTVLAETELPIVIERGDGATLRLSVDGTTIRSAELVDPTTDAARVAAAMAGPVAALAALVGQAVSTVGTDLQTGVNALLTAYEAHRVKVAGCHAAADAFDATGVTASTSQAGAIQLLNRLRD